ncbi:MAG: sigma-70 family RNA polymerase sigma factor [Muribaculaceae bacterium]|nr:sigma-70 family RNA polymerase sigma factor [Muribaculaceae bacterium]
MTPTEFEILARSLRPTLVKTARRMVDKDDADDIVQDTMLKLWSMRDNLDEYRSVEALAVIITKRLAINILRKNSKELQFDDIELSEPSAEDIIIGRQTTDYVNSILASLPDPQQTLIRLRHLEGYDNAAIASLLDISEGAVRTALSRARKRIAEIFKTNPMNKL